MPHNPNWLNVAKQYPAVTMLIALSAVGGVLVSINYPLAIQYFTFDGLTGNSYWRFITPIFLHFGIAHFVFNSLWLSMLGARVERLMGSLHLILLVLVSGILSNIAQFWWSGASNFGGMSGVVYALLGYNWACNTVSPSAVLHLPRGIMGFMMGWLFFCMTPVMPMIFGVGIANAAHVGGLMSGLLLGFVFGFLLKLKRR
jgi:GlpG protein